MAVTASPLADRRTLTYEEFLATDWPNSHVEWVDGEVIDMPPIAGEHFDLESWLGSLFRIYAEHFQTGVFRGDPFQMKTGPELAGRAPDLLFVANASLPRLHRTFLDGPADVVVEIVSPGSEGRDRGDKYFEYERGGVREYWLIDPHRSRAEFYRLDEDGLYQLVSLEEGVFRSESMPGFWLRVEWLWPAERPTVITVLREWGIL